eukprot:CAMPEP_0183359168 /NCGR_PEP_ID=MMETSP0164_2-20130417/51366_1 /TAXON_ID=221442 /ORGANISM="Coccolithus pelagicus ssp braarudi, Strain PLY182g" /LENGTH=123 /DNA_ID=CAMNT_0025533229 /DNA_START=52 /DNA_END=420 /DNA_ORIENTATION=-
MDQVGVGEPTDTDLHVREVGGGQRGDRAGRVASLVGTSMPPHDVSFSNTSSHNDDRSNAATGQQKRDGAITAGPAASSGLEIAPLVSTNGVAMQVNLRHHGIAQSPSSDSKASRRDTRLVPSR